MNPMGMTNKSQVIYTLKSLNSLEGKIARAHCARTLYFPKFYLGGDPWGRPFDIIQRNIFKAKLWA